MLHQLFVLAPQILVLSMLLAGLCVAARAGQLGPTLATLSSPAAMRLLAGFPLALGAVAFATGAPGVVAAIAAVVSAVVAPLGHAHGLSILAATAPPQAPPSSPSGPTPSAGPVVHRVLVEPDKDPGSLVRSGLRYSLARSLDHGVRFALGTLCVMPLAFVALMVFGQGCATLRAWATPAHEEATVAAVESAAQVGCDALALDTGDPLAGKLCRAADQAAAAAADAYIEAHAPPDAGAAIRAATATPPTVRDAGADAAPPVSPASPTATASPRTCASTTAAPSSPPDAGQPLTAGGLPLVVEVGPDGGPPPTLAERARTWAAKLRAKGGSK